jgi:hypothetical protein
MHGKNYRWNYLELIEEWVTILAKTTKWLMLCVYQSSLSTCMKGISGVYAEIRNL